jgi:hypothetical protein
MNSHGAIARRCSRIAFELQAEAQVEVFAGATLLDRPCLPRRTHIHRNGSDLIELQGGLGWGGHQRRQSRPCRRPRFCGGQRIQGRGCAAWNGRGRRSAGARRGRRRLSCLWLGRLCLRNGNGGFGRRGWGRRKSKIERVRKGISEVGRLQVERLAPALRILGLRKGQLQGQSQRRGLTGRALGRGHGQVGPKGRRSCDWQVARAGNRIAVYGKVARAGNGIAIRGKIARAGNGVPIHGKVARAGNGVPIHGKVARAGNSVPIHGEVARAGNGFSRGWQIAWARNGLARDRQITGARHHLARGGEVVQRRPCGWVHPEGGFAKQAYVVDPTWWDFDDDLLSLEALWANDLERSHGNAFRLILSSLRVHRAESVLVLS